MTAGKFDRTSTADEVLAGVDLRGRTILVTGASGGLGEETARALAAAGARVVGTARDTHKAKAALGRIEAASPDADVTFEILDLASLRSVRDFLDRFTSRGDPLHAIIANAGIMAAPQGTTEEGFELHFGTNHLGHFVLVTGLIDQLVAGAPSRVVIVSSAGHRWADIDLADVNIERSRYRRFQAYGASKTANVLFAVELDRRLHDRGVRSFAVHPGGIHTDLGRHMSDDDRQRIAAGAASTGSAYKTVPQGAATSVWAATSPDLDSLGGCYLEDCGVAAVIDDEAPRGVRSFALDDERAQALWALSDNLAAASDAHRI